MDFDISDVLEQPLMAHLSSVENGEPRDSPVWFIYENESIWIFGAERDSFIRRLRNDSRCAIGIVHFDLEAGILLHVGMRGSARVMGVDESRLKRFVAKYLGEREENWNPWFMENIVAPINAMVEIVSDSTVAKDVSYFKNGPQMLAGRNRDASPPGLRQND